MAEPGATLTAAALDDLQARLGVHLHDPSLLAAAMVHRSWAHEHHIASNERLEFLGDAVVGLVAADELFHLCPDQPEGRLAGLRGAAVSQPTLAAIARTLGLGEFILLGVGEADSGGADKDSLLSDTLEALIGAIHLDLGFTPAYEVAQRLLAAPLADLLARATVADPKTALQEYAEASLGGPPRYDTAGSGPDHQPTFTARVRVRTRVLGTGTGMTKKDAERDAAAAALTTLAPQLLAAAVVATPVALVGTAGRGADGPPAGHSHDSRSHGGHD